RSISRSARAQRASARIIPTSISSPTRTSGASAIRTARASLIRKMLDEAIGAEDRTMSYVNFKLDTDASGVALVTWDAPGRSMNVIDPKVIEELGDIVEKVASDPAIKGAVITSGKEAFCAGADLTLLEVFSRSFADMARARGEEAAAALLFEESRKASLLYRRLETCGKPWVAAING